MMTSVLHIDLPQKMKEEKKDKIKLKTYVR